MKNMLKLVAVVGCLLFSGGLLQAQVVNVDNQSNCDFTIRFYAINAACAVVCDQTIPVPANTITNAPPLCDPAHEYYLMRVLGFVGTTGDPGIGCGFNTTVPIKCNGVGYTLDYSGGTAVIN